MKAIKVENLKKVYNPYSAFSKVALKDVSLEVEESEFICIMGTSGSGKTTLLNILSTIDDLTKGKLFIYGKNIFEMSDSEKAHFRKENIGFIFQSYNLINELTVLENIRLPLDLGKMAYDKDYEAEIITLLELEERLKFYPYQLSGGQQQRVAIARALITKPAIILADEPTGNLDKQSGDSIFEFMIKTNKNLHQTYVMVTHNLELANRTKRILTIDDGKIVDDKGLL